MKRLLCFTSLLVMALYITVSAQSTTDTVYIPGSQSLQISDIINADTAVTAHRVYVLDRGAIYYIDRAFEINRSCKFIATGSAARPPVLAPAIRADNTSEEWFFKLIQTGINVELNDLYLLSMRSDGVTLGWSRAIHIGASNCSLKLRRVVFDGWTEAGIRVDGADFTKLDVQDCHFRNFIHSTAYFGGQPFMVNALDHPDTTIFINNTFFACNSYLISVRGLGPLNKFEHNSIVYSAVNPMLIRQAHNFHLNNNIFYAAHAWGGDPEQVNQGWFLNYPDTVSSSVYRIRKRMTYNGFATVGPEAYVDSSLGLFFNFNEWVNVAHNNAFHMPAPLVQFYETWNDTVTVSDSVDMASGVRLYVLRKLTLARWINDMGIAVLDSLADPNNPDYAPGVSVANNMHADPGFTDAATAGHIDSLVAYVRRIATRTLDNPWHFELNFPPVWPLPENLAYNNATLINGGTDGYAVGDLNWFPEQKAQWILGVEQVSPDVPSAFALSNAYPNPFNPETKVNFNIPQVAKVKLVVYNLLGQRVKTIVDQEMQAGQYSATWNGMDDYGKQMSSGIYFFSLESQSFKATKKMILMK